MEGLPVRRAALPAVLPPVGSESPVHVPLLHRGHETEDGADGTGLQEGQRTGTVVGLVLGTVVEVLSVEMPDSPDEQRRPATLHPWRNRESGFS